MKWEKMFFLVISNTNTGSMRVEKPSLEITESDKPWYTQGFLSQVYPVVYCTGIKRFQNLVDVLQYRTL